MQAICANPEHIGVLLTQVGQEEGASAVVRFDDDAWLLTLDDLTVDVTLDARRHVLVFAANLGAPPPDSEPHVYKALLQFTAERIEAGSVRLGLEPADATIVQLEDVPLADLDAAGARQRLSAFVERARATRSALAAGLTGAGDELPQPASRDAWAAYARA